MADEPANNGLVVTDTRTGEKVAFEPLEAGKVRMYVCGLTPYDHIHVGHGRSYVAFDIVRRWLEHRGFDVIHIQNITDIEDKIIDRAIEIGEDPVQLAKHFHGLAEDLLGQLRVLRPHHYPKVSDHIQHIIDMIGEIVDNGHAYPADGNVYFDVESFERYGELSNIETDKLLDETRKEAAPGKRHATDFALWKTSKEGEPVWDSPWGPGRPGWHIECSVMATVIAGPQLDIHGGGRDLQFPHHENEIAQSEAATGVHPFTRYWMHAGFLSVDGEKMSKSLGNFVTLRDVLEKHRPEAVRLVFAGTHYRSPIDFSWGGLEKAERTLDGLVVPLHRVADAVAKGRVRGDDAPEGRDLRVLEAIEGARGEFAAAMDDDFDTPRALATVHTLTTTLNAYLDEGPPHADAVREVEDWYGHLDAVFGILPPERGGDLEAPILDLLVEVREGLRTRKEFELADTIRDRLAELGVSLEDTDDGPTWRRR